MLRIADLELFVDPEAGALAKDADAVEETPVSDLPGEELPKVFRARADAERRDGAGCARDPDRAGNQVAASSGGQA